MLNAYNKHSSFFLLQSLSFHLRNQNMLWMKVSNKWRWESGEVEQIYPNHPVWPFAHAWPILSLLKVSSSSRFESINAKGVGEWRELIGLKL